MPRSEDDAIFYAFEGPQGKVRITPPLFPNQTMPISPANLDHFAPTGTGIYGLREHIAQPFKEGPIHEPNGGILFFENGVSKEDFTALTRILGIPQARPSGSGWERKYAAFVKKSENPREEGYLTQLRLVHASALSFLYGAITSEELDTYPVQELSMPAALYSFMEDQRKEYGTMFGHPNIEGKFGGDGDFAREELSFGLMVENDYNHIYRIWSRGWLVTK